MKKLKNIIIAGSILGLTSLSSVAEGNGGNGFINAAKKYEQKSRQARNDGNHSDANIYKKLAQIKRAAAKALANGEDFSWKEYYALQGKLTGKKHKKHHAKKGKHGKHAQKGGANEAAERYERLSAKARANDDEASALVYDRLAQIKRDAAAHRGDEPFDWSEYHELNGKLNGGAKKNPNKLQEHRTHGKKKAKKGGNGFLKAAAKYTEKANDAMKNGNEHNARIYTRLAGMKRDAAAAADRGEGYDWTEYFKLQKQLK